MRDLSLYSVSRQIPGTRCHPGTRMWRWVNVQVRKLPLYSDERPISVQCQQTDPRYRYHPGTRMWRWVNVQVRDLSLYSNDQTGTMCHPGTGMWRWVNVQVRDLSAFFHGTLKNDTDPNPVCLSIITSKDHPFGCPIIYRDSIDYVIRRRLNNACHS